MYDTPAYTNFIAESIDKLCVTSTEVNTESVGISKSNWKVSERRKTTKILEDGRHIADHLAEVGVELFEEASRVSSRHEVPTGSYGDRHLRVGESLKST